MPGVVTWRALLAMVKYSPRTSALVREMFGEEVTWSTTDHLLAGILDYSAVIAWLNSDTKKNKRPAPIKRPGVEPETTDLTFGAGSTVPVSEFWQRWQEGMPDEESQQLELEGKDPATALTVPGDGQPG